MVINGCAQSGPSNQRLAVSQEKINGINLFLVR